MLPALELMRPRQWIKNGFVIAPIFFAQRFDQWSAWALTLSAAAAFALVASATYIFNDLVDRKQDRLHPLKSRRPLAAGTVRVGTALLLAAICLAAAVSLLASLPQECTLVIAIYLLLNGAYTLVLKQRALLDVFVIASCFVLRVLAGCFALSVMVSPWIMLTTFMLALFISFGKRYHELGVSGYAAAKPSLKQYNRELLDKLVVICGASALVCYAIYTAEMAKILGTIYMVYTVPFVAFGLFRYLQSIYVMGQGGEPESIILRDAWQWVNITLWLVITLWALG